MAPNERRELELWTARFGFETLVELLASTEGIDERRVEWEGELFHPVQLERLAAWAEDQAATASALGVDRRVWSDAVVGAYPWYRDDARRANRQGPDEQRLAAARKFLGG